MNHLVQATLIKKETEDGMVTVRDHIPIGTKYLIDPSSERLWTGINLDKGCLWTRKMVMANNGRWLPSELLDWEGKAKIS